MGVFSAATVVLFSGAASGAASDYSCRIQCSGGYVVAGVVRAYGSSEPEKKIIEQIKLKKFSEPNMPKGRGWVC